MGMFSSIWNKHLGGKSTPWADISYVGKKVTVRNYNAAFVQDLRASLGDLTIGKTDEEVVNLFSDRENLELEEPRLEVVHNGVNADGLVKVTLNWNRAFISHLAKLGIAGENEEESVHAYLKMVSPRGTDDHQDDLDEAFSDIDNEAQAELEEAARAIEAENRRRTGVQGRKPTRRRKVNRTTE